MKTLYYILSFCAGLLLGYLLFRELVRYTSIYPQEPLQAIKMKHIQQQKALKELALKKQNDLLESHLKAIDKQLSASKDALFHERQMLKMLHLKLLDNHAPALDSLDKNQLALRLDILNTVTDSLLIVYETKLQITQSMLAVRDSQLVVCNGAYQQAQSLVTEQVARERQLTEDLNTALKQQKRTRLKSRLLGGGMLFLSGLTATLLLR